MNESLDQKKKRVSNCIKLLYKQYPDATTALMHSSALELLISTVLSAQCTDERVNKVTEQLFKKYRTAKDFAGLLPQKLEPEIRSINFFRNKAKNIIKLCKILLEKYNNGEVPNDMQKLLELPGVARKTANVVLGTYYRNPTGIVVDTHVFRVSQRLGLSTAKDPKKLEQDLLGIIPKEAWIDFGHMMIWHGRKVCQARKPMCESCILETYCPSSRV